MSNESCLQESPSPAASTTSGDTASLSEQKGLYTSQQWRFLSPKFLVCIQSMGGRTYVGFSPLLEVSDEDTSLGDPITDTSYSTGCVAPTEKVSAQFSRCKVKPFPAFILNAASILITAGASSCQRQDTLPQVGSLDGVLQRKPE